MHCRYRTLCHYRVAMDAKFGDNRALTRRSERHDARAPAPPPHVCPWHHRRV